MHHVALWTLLAQLFLLFMNQGTIELVNAEKSVGKLTDQIRKIAAQLEKIANKKTEKTEDASTEKSIVNAREKEFIMKTDCKDYVVVKERALWSEALKNCEDRQMKLLSIETKEESSCIYKLKTDYEVDLNTPKAEFWTSGRLGKKPAFEWSWAGSKEKFSFTNWSKGNPDNFMKMEECVEFTVNYAVNSPTDMQWNDGICTFKKYYICESP